MSTGGLRLKVELNRIVKFYIKTPEFSTFSELKKTISKILKASYDINLTKYSLRSEDGFELLDIFKVGDLLSNDQVIIIDAFTGSSIQRQKIPVENSISAKKASVVTLPILKSREETKTRTEISKESPVAIKTVNEDIVKKVPENIAVPAKDENIQPVLEAKACIKPKDFSTPESINANTIEKVQNLQKATLQNVDRNIAVPVQPKPENFKGFAVKKSDLAKEQSIKSDVAFKPLKKRKIEENRFEDAF